MAQLIQWCLVICDRTVGCVEVESAMYKVKVKGCAQAAAHNTAPLSIVVRVRLFAPKHTTRGVEYSDSATCSSIGKTGRSCSGLSRWWKDKGDYCSTEVYSRQQMLALRCVANRRASLWRRQPARHPYAATFTLASIITCRTLTLLVAIK